MSFYDCVVVGSGHAGSCAALSAIESGCRKVLLVDKCPSSWAGGNGYFTAGAFRTVHGGLSDLLPIVRGTSVEEASLIDMEPYTSEEFTADIRRLSSGRSDPTLVKTVVDKSRDTIGWLASDVGIPFILSFNRQAYIVNGRQKFWGGMVLSVQDGGKGLIAAHQRALIKAGVEMWYDTPATALLVDQSAAITGVVVQKDGKPLKLTSCTIIIAAGGFEANAEMRKRYLGPEWVNARVRGTPFNTGDGFVMAQAVGAQLKGDFAGLHSTAWDANTSAESGDRERTNQFTKSGYPLGIMVNIRGERFVDEGQDFRNYTYAKFGRAILEQPGGVAFQIFDAQVIDWLRKEEYADEIVEKIIADDVGVLADKLVEKGLLDKNQLLSTIATFNEAIHHRQAEHPHLRWDPSVKDGLSTQSSILQFPLPKSHWALPIEKPPFVAVKVASGITFTFGGLAIEPGSAGVLSEATGAPIPGLFCTGEIVGGLFYGNYPGGSGLTAGAVFGRIAGQAAARYIAEL